MEELARHRCHGDDGTTVTVVEYRYVHIGQSQGGTPRRYPGARQMALTTGQAVRYVDAETFEVVGSGELLARIR
ncbi:MAG: hypothetical protein V4610_19220 [Pseudomonadota bacterium]|jgi:hypothetical protein|uniref:Uncharacterized protein n=1 Tax=hydrothermal vent metagenome TaxID=652676 RepID=A0A160THU7_9ZZZZ